MKQEKGGNMENGITISVIIPVYNSEKCVRRAVESVLVQMNERVELILVDDGSTDCGGAVCDEYSRNHPRVKVVHKINGGLSSARNAGLPVAEGEYIVFLDADDYLAPNACEEISKVIHEHHPDCIDFGWNYVHRNGEITKTHHKITKDVLLGDDVVKNLILPPLLHLKKNDDHCIFDYAWMKVYRRQIIEENSVYFDEGRRIWEDRPFVCHYLKYCHNYYSMSRHLYYYVFTEGSMGQRYSLDFFRIILVTFRHYVGLFGDEFDFDTQYVNNHWCSAIENIIYRSLEQTQNQEMIRETILNTLRDEQTVYWYQNRQPANAFQKKMSALVVAGEVEAALQSYENHVVQKRRQQKKRDAINRIKSNIKGIIRRMWGR